MVAVTREIIESQTVKAVIVDGRAAPLIQKSLNSMGIKVIETIMHPCLYDAIAFHPDAVICPAGRGKMVVEPTMYEYYKKALYPYRIELVKGSTELSRNYPLNIAYNIATVGNKAFLNSRHADRVASQELKKSGIGLINVKQGYAKCSTAVIGNNGIITSDLGIHKTALRNGMDALLINPGHIELKAFDYGFIGGCCGMIGNSTLAFVGRQYEHPDWTAMSEFISRQNIKAVSLYDGPLLDVGSLIPVVEKK